MTSTDGSTKDGTTLTIMRQSPAAETTDGTGTDSVVKIAGDRLLKGYYFPVNVAGDGTSNAAASTTPGVTFEATLLPTLVVTTGASYLAAGLALAASVSMMAF